MLNVLSFYKWAFGDLTEQDSDIGMLAEYLVGDILNCLPPTRKVNAPFDLIMKDGTSLEIKATTHQRVEKGRNPYYRWDVSTQSEMLKDNRPIADYWVFLMASFPREASRTPPGRAGIRSQELEVLCRLRREAANGGLHEVCV